MMTANELLTNRRRAIRDKLHDTISGVINNLKEIDVLLEQLFDLYEDSKCTHATSAHAQTEHQT